MNKNQADLAKLPKHIATKARITTSGEVEWQFGDAPAAIKALAKAGFIILGLEARSYEDGTFEVPLSSFKLKNGDYQARVLAAKQAALNTLDREDLSWDKLDWILITWQ